ncbi:transposase [Seonamhaeicola marinus]|uniref:Transposase IS200-like domain-containing protein n=1 Tax=Seonamhaeicola marinus TaxID=1912246 RepID=A0A5D0HRT1_9FLAO|nr:transposase [Seonamhaeicola marinus]TYA74056.1 hypothetical protein FUA24_11965 [Seonamhaeicola marinus]
MLEKLEKDHYYHIYNRGINSSNIFMSDDNMDYFLKLIDKHLKEKIEVIAYCLMNNHFHLITKVNTEGPIATQSLSNLFNAYAKAFNKQQNRTGSLFEKHFKRKKILNEEYLKNLILYVHKNPQNHKVINDFRNYKFTSFNSYLTSSSPEKNYVVSLFENIENFKFAHEKDLQGFENLAGQETHTTNTSIP